MKSREGFVSNSSSTSFTISFEENAEHLAYLKKVKKFLDDVFAVDGDFRTFTTFEEYYNFVGDYEEVELDELEEDERDDYLNADIVELLKKGKTVIRCEADEGSMANCEALDILEYPDGFNIIVGYYGEK